ncbi:hypothetical protein QQX98_008368 [Neonectria punicea]|uniref:SH3 domain-containing protein n=1 Tax=Neonectria punicea TaxID=979145 RepID=A0ABR1GVC4_9HYPO
MAVAHGHLHRRAGVKHQVVERNAVVKTVYVTASATFEGGVAGYSTVGKAVKATKAVDKDSDASEDKDSGEKDEVKTTAKPKATNTAKAEKKETTEEKKVVKTTQEKEKEKTKTTEAEETETTKRAKTTKTSKAQAKTTSTEEDTSSVPSAITNPTDTESVESVLAKATGQASASTTIEASAAETAASTLSSTSASAEASTSNGSSSAGTKAGIAFGVLGGIFVVGLLVFFLFSRRRKQAESQRLKDDDEKLHGPINPAVVVAASTAPRSDPKAPRISLRPVTQFLPNWNLEKRTSKGAAMALAVPGAAAGGAMTSRAAPGGSAWERPSTAQSADPANPFGAQAERLPTPIIEESIHERSATPGSAMESDAMRAVSPVSSISTMSPASDPLTANGSPVGVAGAAAAGASAALLARKTSMRKDGPKKLDLTLPNAPLAAVPPSPAGTEFSMSSAAPGASDAPSQGAAAIAAAGGPVNSSVYRVQLDFKPTLDDELGLMAGDLVRMLHEYDDGWALCIRLDRSQQGVVPRTCLSTRPVKPRPAQGGPRLGPPVNPSGLPRGPMGPPGQRPMTPQGMQRPMTPQGMQAQGRPGSPAGRPMTPNGGRSQSPMGRPMNHPGRPAGRPMSPGPRSQSPGPRQGPPAGSPLSPGPRSQSPGPRQGSPGGRSQSPSGANRRNSPPGPSPMNPSQAPRQAPPIGPPTGPVGRKPVPGQAY